MGLNFRRILLVLVAFCLVISSYSYPATITREYNVILNDPAQEAEDLMATGDYAQAVKKYEEALSIYEAQDHGTGVLFCLARMGWIKRELGEYGEALQILRRAYELGVRYNGDAAEIDTSIGDVYMFSGDTEKAIEHYTKALDTTRDFELKTAFFEPPTRKELSTMFRKVKAILHARIMFSVMYYFDGDYEETLKHLEPAREINDKVWKIVGSKYYDGYFRPDFDIYNSAGYTNTLMGATYASMGKYDKAWEYFDKGKEAFDTGQRYYGSLLNRALRFLERSKLPDYRIDDAKMKAYDEFLEEADKFGATELVWRMCYEVGNVLLRENRDKEAYDYYARAIQTLELTRARLREDAIKKIFSGSVQDVYYVMINLSFDMEDFEEGFDYLERSKARAFLDVLAGRSLEAKKSVDPALIQREKEIQQKLSVLTRQPYTTDDSKERGIKVIRKITEERSDEYQRLLVEQEKILADIKEQSLEFAATTSVSTVPVKEIATRLGKDTALVSYFLGQERTIIWVVKHDQIYAVSVDISEDRLAGLVADYRKAIAKKDEDSIFKLGKELYGFLIAPVRAKLAGTDKLFIVPSKSLHYLPFSSLGESRGSFLVQDFTISVLPNASSLFFLDKEVTKDRKRILAVGNPEREEGLSLAFAEEEVRVISAHFPQSRVLTGKDARETVFRDKDIVDTGIIHIAAHGKYDTQDPLKSALLLTPDEGNDGNLETFEIFSLTMNPRLVVLSACESGIGKIQDGDEVQSLNRAFLYAGAGKVLASLWSVSDESTSKLMEYFYKGLNDKPAALALQEAQKTLMKEYPSPYYWAAFYLTGGMED